MLVQHHSQRIHHVAATYPSTAEPRKYLPQSRKTSVIVPIRIRIAGRSVVGGSECLNDGEVAQDGGVGLDLVLREDYAEAHAPY